MRRVVYAILFVLSLPFWPALWLACRFGAKRCPRCQSKWRTELVGEWHGEEWRCHACGLWFGEI